MAAEAVVSVAVETLGNLLIQKAVFLQGVEGEVEWVRKELKRMRCFLKDAANKQSDSDSIRNWISEIREVAYDAEDAIERFVVHVETRGLQERCACFPRHLSRLDKIGKEIESIRKRLKDIESSRLSYGIQDLGESSRTRSQLQVESRRRLAYWEQDRDVVGLEKDVELLLGRAILEERGGLSVASILGMGGIGKSTLARKIYNHPRIAGGYFERRAWVVVSSEFTTEDIMRQVLVQLGISLKRLKLLESVDDRLRCRQNLQEELHKCLTGKRYLIVLDDVWEASHWESLRPSFPVEEIQRSLRRSCRNKNTAAAEADGPLHQDKAEVALLLAQSAHAGQGTSFLIDLLTLAGLVAVAAVASLLRLLHGVLHGFAAALLAVHLLQLLAALLKKLLVVLNSGAHLEDLLFLEGGGAAALLEVALARAEVVPLHLLPALLLPGVGV